MKKRKIKTEWIFTKDLKDKVIIYAPHDLKVGEYPVVIVPAEQKGSE